MISVVIPAYNEEKDIEAAVLDVYKAIPDAEIIVVDDASTDSTPLLLERLKQEISRLTVLTNEENMGHGASVVRGLRAATGEYILYIDADRQINISNLAQLEGFEAKNVEFVSGYRLHRNDKLFRKVISFCLKSTNLLFHRMYIKDANCPFKLYKRSALQPLLNQLPTSYVIPVACLEVLARKRGLRQMVIATPHLPYEGVRQGFLQVPNWSAWKFFIRAFFEIVKI